MDSGSSTPSILEFARDDGGGGTNRLHVHANRLRGGKAAQAVMVDNFDEVVSVQAVHGLEHLVMIDEDDLSALGNRLDKAGLFDAALAHDPLGLGRKRPQAHRLEDGLLARAARELVFQVCIPNSRADGVVIRVFVTDDDDR